MSTTPKFDYTNFKNHKLLDSVRPVLKVFLNILYKVEFEGLENIDRNDGFIIAPNHVTELDPFFVGMASKRRFRFIAKSELFKNPVLNKVMTQFNAFPVVRGIGDKRALNFAIELVRRGEILCIFPEGTRSPDGTPKEAKSGVGYIARYTGADIIPTAIYMEDKDKKGSKVIVNFGEAFKYEDMGFTDNGKTSENKAVARKTMDMITTLWEECKCR